MAFGHNAKGVASMFTSVDVTHFGAKGDGITDDAAAFQEAVDSLQGIEGRVTLPANQSEKRRQQDP
jgi:polygalacturonase